ncbi:DUF397 domain-containing protein [Kitasatospora sp. RB6PN24]|uniref:DUF397 domain-containing protein n=1 Tax=Kitasatospora humi TaxID=2893891 RepID=UPI001E4FEE4F|nr:DUF397 domain-containing protein [Kitasatospora humi]MCC9310460.1 DUF397 domain-containing protein [Kitasatospora humi]
MSDLYEAKVVGPYTALCGGSTDNDGSAEDCMKVAELEGGIGYAVGDTKLGEGSPALHYTKAELVNGAKQILAMFGEDASAAVA